MDRRERRGATDEAMRAVQQELAATLWTALPGIVDSYNPAKQTCSIKPAIKARVQDHQGNYTWVELPLCLDCPVHFPAGGGLALTFPVKQGDEALIIFADRCIDNWWQRSGIQEQAEFRMHDLSDGHVLVGISSLPKVMPGLSTNAAQLRTQAGTSYVEVQAGGNINLTTPGNVSVAAGGTASVTATTINMNATTINLVGALMINGSPYLAHKHNNVQIGSSNSGGVVP